MSSPVVVEGHGRVLVVALDRPHRRNAVDRATADALEQAFVAFDQDPAYDVAVLTGRGGTFCAGADLHALSTGQRNRLEPEGPGPMGPTRLLFAKPVIAAIEGHAVAGGLELALWADLRVAARDAVLGVFCRRVGVPLIDGGTVRLPRLIGESRAMDLILTGRRVDAEEAAAIGLVNRVVESGQALAAALTLAEELSQLPQTCLRSDRLSVLSCAGLGETEALAVEFGCGQAALQEIQTGHNPAVSRFQRGAGRHGEPL